MRPIQTNFQYSLSQKKLKRKRKKLLLGSFFAFLILSVLMYSIFYTKYFNVKNISVLSDDVLQGEDLNSIRQAVLSVLNQHNWLFVSRENFWVLPKAKIADTIQSNFPRVGNIEINKHLFALLFSGGNADLEIKIKERKPVGIACQGVSSAECFYFDSSGVIFEKAPDISGVSVLSIKDDSLTNNQSLPYNKYSAKFVDYITNFKKELVKNTRVEIDHYSPIDQFGDLEIITSGGFKMQLNIDKPIDKQVQVLKGILDKEIKDRTNDLDYIDLRVENRVYYKYKE